MSRSELVRSRIQDARQLLRELSAVPNVPFREHGVLDILRSHLRAIGVSSSSDRWGNLFGRYQSGTGGRPIALVAHTDHPGFEIVESRSAGADQHRARAKMLGRVWVEHLAEPVPVRVFATGRIVSGAVERAWEEAGEMRLDLLLNDPVSVGDAGIWALPDYFDDGPFIRMRSVDDLGGCSVIVQTLRELVRNRVDGDITAVFTRAEEVGLVGATLVARDRTLAPETLVISIETSKALPAAEPGRGPVIRVGDARRAFDPTGEALLLVARSRLEGLVPPVRVQRQLMSGGTCEATAFAAYGYQVTGVALPLGNYHNAAGDRSIAMESIHVEDLSGAIDLLIAAIQSAGDPTADGSQGERSRYDPLADAYAPLLESTARASVGLQQAAERPSEL